MVHFGFLPKMLVRWWRPTNKICCSVNVHRVVVLFACGGNTSTLHVVIELFALKSGGEQKLVLNALNYLNFSTQGW